MAFLSDSTVQDVERTQIGTSGLKSSVVRVEVGVADAIRRASVKNTRVDGIDELRIVRRERAAGYCRIIKRKCGIKSSDSVRKRRKMCSLGPVTVRNQFTFRIYIDRMTAPLPFFR